MEYIERFVPQFFHFMKKIYPRSPIFKKYFSLARSYIFWSNVPKAL